MDAPAESAVALSPPGPQPYADPQLERTYQEARERLLRPPKFQQKTVFLLLSLVAFVLASAGSDVKQTALDLVILVGVIAFHEAGHYVGMRAFGYRDVTVFFVPFLGAATAGKPQGVAPWKEGVVLLLGPLPGVALGVVLLALVGSEPSPQRSVMSMLLLLNGFNLLPMNPLDGGQLLRLLLFSRSRVTEAAFTVVSSVLMVGLGLAIDAWFLAAISVFPLLGLGWRWKLSAAAKTLAPLGLPPAASALDERQTRALFETTHALGGGQAKDRAGFLAREMDNLLQLATSRPPSALSTLGFLGVWGAGLAVSITAAFIAIMMEGPKWERVQRPEAGFSIELPGSASEDKHEGGATLYVGRRLVGYTVRWEPAPAEDAEARLRQVRDLVLGQRQSRLGREETLDSGLVRYQSATELGDPGRGLMLVRGKWLYVVDAVGPEKELPDMQRFLDSFRLEEAGELKR